MYSFLFFFSLFLYSSLSFLLFFNKRTLFSLFFIFLFIISLFFFISIFPPPLFPFLFFPSFALPKPSTTQLYFPCLNSLFIYSFLIFIINFLFSLSPSPLFLSFPSFLSLHPNHQQPNDLLTAAKRQSNSRRSLVRSLSRHRFRRTVIFQTTSENSLT